MPVAQPPPLLVYILCRLVGVVGNDIVKTCRSLLELKTTRIPFFLFLFFSERSVGDSWW